MAKPLIYLVSGTCWCCSAPGYSLNGYGSTPREAYEKWLRTEVKMEIARAKASVLREEEVMEVFEESHRVVLDEVLRIGKKVLPVILALVAGFLIGRLYG